MMPEKEYKELIDKVNREFPVRIKLAEMAGRKINSKNYKALEDFDDTIAELFLEITLNHPQNVPDAITLIRTIK